MKIKRFAAMLAILTIILSAVGLASPVYAADLTQKGTLTIVTEYNKNVLSGINIEIYLIATAVEDNGEITYIPTGNFAGALNNIELDPFMVAGDNVNLALILRNYISGNTIRGILAATDNNGTVYFSDLAAGMYLITQNNASAVGNNGRYNIQSFIVPVPYLVDDGFLNYIVLANPKIEEIPPTTEPTTESTTGPPPPTTGPTEPPTLPTEPSTIPTQPVTTQPTIPTTVSSTEPTIDTTEPVTTTEPPTEPTIGTTEPSIEEEFTGTIPLGNITFPTEEDFEFVDNTVPLGNIDTPEIPPKTNPKTGDYIMFAIFGLFISGGIVIAMRKMKSK